MIFGFLIGLISGILLFILITFLWVDRVIKSAGYENIRDLWDQMDGD